MWRNRWGLHSHVQIVGREMMQAAEIKTPHLCENLAATSHLMTHSQCVFILDKQDQESIPPSVSTGFACLSFTQPPPGIDNSLVFINVNSAVNTPRIDPLTRCVTSSYNI